MNWYEGEIAEAIEKCKRENLIFMVYVYEQNTQNQEMTVLWSHEQIASILTNECVCLKLEATSESCKQFSEFYKVLVYPTTYFIDDQGVPIEIVAGVVSVDEMLEKLNKTIQTYRSKKPKITAKKSINDKVAEAREKLRLIQEKKAKEEEEKHRQEELERRKLGQEMLKMKQLKEQEEIKRMVEENRREKAQADQAKKVILEKIQRDREEKQRKFNEEKERVEKIKSEEREARKQEEVAQQNSIARLQFRLTDGSTLVQQFESDQKLSEVVTWLTNKLHQLNQTNTNFTLHTTYPKRVFGQADMCSSLNALQLAPSASLLVMLGRSRGNLPSTVARSSFGLFDFLRQFGLLILIPVNLVWGFLRGFFVSTQQVEAPPVPPRQETSQQFLARKREETLRKRSNIGTLHNGSDNNKDDDKNATWNGNSTQQM